MSGTRNDVLEPTEALRAEVARLRAENGALRHALSNHISVDDTEQTAERRQRALITRLGHEIRTPLNGVVGMAALIARTDLSDEQIDYVDAIRRSAGAVVEVLEKVLGVTELDERRPSESAFDLLELIEDVAVHHAPPSASSGVDFVLCYPPGTPRRVVADRDRVREILVNLVENAVKFTSDGHVILRADTPKARIDGEPARFAITIEDTGVGMDESTLRGIAEVDSPDGSRRPMPDRGLGLALTRRYVKKLGGRIDVASQVGAGTRITVRLPLAVMPQPEIDASIDAARRLRGARVLIASPGRALRRTLHHQLAFWGADCVVCGTAGAALDLLRQGHDAGRPYRLVLVDELLPGQAGLRLNAKFRTETGLLDIAPVLITATVRGGAAAGDERRRAAYVAQLAKPVRPSHVIGVLASALGARSRPVAIRRTDGMGASRPQILLVEDDAMSRRVVSAYLERLECDVEVVEDGEKAIEKGARGGFDLVLMDCQLPGVDGYEATARLRWSFSPEELPIVALTAFALPGDREKCIEAGMNDYLAKPFTIAELETVLDRWTRRAALADAT